MNIFDNVTRDAPQEIFETIAQNENVRIERIVSNGQSSPDGFWYEQNEHEWILVLRGRAALRFEGESEDRVLETGDYLAIPSGVRHRVVWTSDREPTIWLAVFYR